MISSPAREQHHGVLGMSAYIPKNYISQTALEIHDSVSCGKYTLGLGQTSLAFTSDREDINSISLSALHQLLDDYSVDLTRVGRLEVGTESAIDRSKSVKSVLMQLFADSGNSDIEGVDTTNACYGGTDYLIRNKCTLQRNQLARVLCL